MNLTKLFKIERINKKNLNKFQKMKRINKKKLKKIFSLKIQNDKYYSVLNSQGKPLITYDGRS